MKKHFLVKGSERHEVKPSVSDKNVYLLTDSDALIDKGAFDILGYELQEVNEREECWCLIDSDVLHLRPHLFLTKSRVLGYQSKYGGTIKHMVALEDDERIVSREVVERAWKACGWSSGWEDGQAAFDKLCDWLGFGEGDE